MTAPKVYAHGIGGGWDVRHADTGRVMAPKGEKMLGTIYQTDTDTYYQGADGRAWLVDSVDGMPGEGYVAARSVPDSAEVVPDDDCGPRTIATAELIDSFVPHVACVICSANGIADYWTPATTAIKIDRDPFRDGAGKRTVYACPDCVKAGA